MKITHIFYHGWGDNQPKISTQDEEVVLKPVWNEWKEKDELEKFINRPEGLIDPWEASDILYDEYYGVRECGKSYEGYFILDNDNKIIESRGNAIDIYNKYPQLF